MVTDVIDLGVLATSDHYAVQWKLLVSTVSCERTRQVFDYARADICRIKTELASHDWENLFCNRSVEDCWGLFKDVLHQLETKYVGRQLVVRQIFWSQFMEALEDQNSCLKSDPLLDW